MINHYASFQWRSIKATSLRRISSTEWRTETILQSGTSSSDSSIVDDDSLIYEADDIAMSIFNKINPDLGYDKNNYKDRSTRYIARVSYDGTYFRGFQEQDVKTRTVQGTLSKALISRYSNKYLLRVTGAIQIMHMSAMHMLVLSLIYIT